MADTLNLSGIATLNDGEFYNPSPSATARVRDSIDNLKKTITARGNNTQPKGLKPVDSSFGRILLRFAVASFMENKDLQSLEGALHNSNDPLSDPPTRAKTPTQAETEKTLMAAVENPTPGTAAPTFSNAILMTVVEKVEGARNANEFEKHTLELEAQMAALNEQAQLAAQAQGQQPTNANTPTNASGFMLAATGLREEYAKLVEQKQTLQQQEKNLNAQRQGLASLVPKHQQEWGNLRQQSLQNTLAELQKNEQTRLNQDEQNQFLKNESWNDLFEREANQRGGQSLSPQEKQKHIDGGIAAYIQLKAELSKQADPNLTLDQQEAQRRNAISLVPAKAITREEAGLTDKQGKETGDKIKAVDGAHDGVQGSQLQLAQKAKELAEKVEKELKKRRQEEEEKKRQEEEEEEARNSQSSDMIRRWYANIGYRPPEGHLAPPGWKPPSK